MKKSELIKYLQTISGDPPVCILEDDFPKEIQSTLYTEGRYETEYYWYGDYILLLGEP